jgi:hypothetical protein
MKSHTNMSDSSGMRRYQLVMVLLTIVFCCHSCSRAPERIEPFRIVVVKSDFSLAYSKEVILTDSLIQVSFLGGLAGERPHVAWSQLTSAFLADTLISFLQSVRLDTLQRIYSNFAVADGMQYYFQLEFRGDIKKVQLSNIWVPQLLRLTQIVNAALPDSLRLSVELPRVTNSH